MIETRGVVAADVPMADAPVGAPEQAPQAPLGPQGAAPAGRPVISVVAPAWNEAATLPLFVAETRAVLEGLGEPWEIVLVDDGSADATRAVLRDLHAADA